MQAVSIVARQGEAGLSPGSAAHKEMTPTTLSGGL